LGCVRATTLSRTFAISCDDVIKILVSKLDEIIDTIYGRDRILVDLTERRGGLVTTIHVVPTTLGEVLAFHERMPLCDDGLAFLESTFPACNSAHPRQLASQTCQHRRSLAGRFHS